jgi:hypothetical protein
VFEPRGTVGNIILQKSVFVLSSLKRYILVLGLCVSWLNTPALLFGQSEPCKLDFELSPDCIAELGLQKKLATFEHKIAEAQRRLGASYKIRVRVIGSLMFTRYSDNVGPVFTEAVRDADMRNESFITSVTADFLSNQPEILFEHSAIHEVAHIMNDDLEGYHRNGANIELAEERVVLNLVGEARYQKYLRAYAKYRNWSDSRYNEFLEAVKAVELVPMPSEIDEADKLAAATFKKIADGTEHLLVYNGEIHDISTDSTINTVRHDPEKLSKIIKAGKPMIFFHNHPSDGTRSMFPSFEDFGVASIFESLVLSQNPDLPVEFRVMVVDKQTTSVSYGFKKRITEDPQKIAEESFQDYLQYACPVDLTSKNPEICNTHPEFFLWPSDKFFLRYRGVVEPRDAQKEMADASVRSHRVVTAEGGSLGAAPIGAAPVFHNRTE